EEGTLLVKGIEGLGLLAGHANALLGNDAKPGLLDQRIDGAGQIARGRVRLDDGKGALDRHDLVPGSADGSCGLISAPPVHGKRSGEMWRQTLGRHRCRHYDNFTKVNRS